MGKNRNLTIYQVTTDSSAQIRWSGYRVLAIPGRTFHGSNRSSTGQSKGEFKSMDENERVFLAAAILLAPVGRFPADEAQIQHAVTNAYKLHAEVKRQHEEADTKLERSGVEKANRQ